MARRYSSIVAAVLLFSCLAVKAEDKNPGESAATTRTSVFDLSDAHLDLDYLTLPNSPVSTRPDLPDLSPTDASSRSSSKNIEIEPSQPTTLPEGGVQWKKLMKGSLLYLGVMHSFRLATEQGTRDGLGNSLVGGYFQALGAMHGWSDGDSYYENYLGHPIQGAVSGYMWAHTDLKYRSVQFGGSRDYWMSRLRAYAFAWAFSEQFEIGPLSEASIGQIQRYCCAYGFVDHIITPNGGLVWMVAGDALDRYVTVPIENHTQKVGLRILARVGLNPAQSFANLMMMQYPWRRENRPTVSEFRGEMYRRPPSESLAGAVNPRANPGGFDITPRFEISAEVPAVYRMGGLNCLGGGGVGAVRASDFWQWTLEVNGCTLGNSLPRYWAGDSLTLAVGPQWIAHSFGRWSPHAMFRVGVQKITEDQTDPKKREQILSNLPPGASANDYYYEFTKHWESTGLTVKVGGGVDVALNRALALRVANLDYSRSWLGSLNGTNFDHGLRFASGVVLRLGTW